jgi:hypothetical protein
MIRRPLGPSVSYFVSQNRTGDNIIISRPEYSSLFYYLVIAYVTDHSNDHRRSHFGNCKTQPMGFGYRHANHITEPPIKYNGRYKKRIRRYLHAWIAPVFSRIICSIHPMQLRAPIRLSLTPVDRVPLVSHLNLNNNLMPPLLFILTFSFISNKYKRWMHPFDLLFEGGRRRMQTC